MKAAGAGPNEILAYNLAAIFPALLDLQQSIEREKTGYTEELVTAKADFNKVYDSGVNSFLLSAIIITLLAIATAISTMMGITKPLHALREGTEMIARGNLSHKVGTKSGDEIGQLGRAFDQMTQKLSRSMTSIDNLNREIAERKHTESALKESEEKFRNLFDHAMDAILLVDAQTGFLLQE